MPESRVLAIVILAAGGASRFGSPKQLLLFEGKSLLQNSLDVACDTVRKFEEIKQAERVSDVTEEKKLLSSIKILVILGANEGLIRSQVDFTHTTTIVNEQWSMGMSTSIKTAITHLLQTEPNIQSALFLLADAPYINASLLLQIVAKYEETGECIVCSSYGGDNVDAAPVLGVPALFSKEMFSELMALDGDLGARKVIAANGDNAVAIPFAEGIIDIDTMADYRALNLKSRLENIL